MCPEIKLWFKKSNFIHEKMLNKTRYLQNITNNKIQSTVYRHQACSSFAGSAISDVQVQIANDSEEKCAVRANFPLNKEPDKRISALHTRNDVTENGVRKMPAMFRQIGCHKHKSLLFRLRKWKNVICK